MLILGSTTEYRDWAFEQRYSSVVVDNSADYHRAVTRELTHKPSFETFVLGDWRTMTFVDEFDLVVGDLAVGQVKLGEVELLIDNVARALRRDGYFLTKSFFRNAAPVQADIASRISSLSEDGIDPFPHVVYDLAATCVGEDGILLFARMIETIRSFYQEGRISWASLQRFEEFGWDGPFKVHFTMPELREWHEVLQKTFGAFDSFPDPDRPHLASLPMYACRRML